MSEAYYFRWVSYVCDSSSTLAFGESRCWGGRGKRCLSHCSTICTLLLPSMKSKNDSLAFIALWMWKGQNWKAHLFNKYKPRTVFYYWEIWEKKNVNWDHCLFFFMLQEAWLYEEAAIWQNVLKCEHRTGILSLSAARAEQLFTLKFWCGISLNFLQQLYSSFCLSCATAITVLSTRWLLKFRICSLSMLGVTPAEKLCLFKTNIKKKKKV